MNTPLPSPHSLDDCSPAVQEEYDEWDRGRDACDIGFLCPAGESDGFERGYAWEYEHEAKREKGYGEIR